MLSRALSRASFSGMRAMSTKAPVKVALTGAAGAIGYAALFRICSGDMLGRDQPIKLQLLELPHAMDALKGTIMELQDGAFPLVHSISGTDDVNEAFDDADYALLVGSKPRGPGMERGDLLRDNGAIFTTQGKALNDNAKKSVKVLVVGNPANTNCLIAAANAPDIPRENFCAMTKLDHGRGLAQLAEKTGSLVTDISNFCVWGNHSPTMYPDITHCTIKGQDAASAIGDPSWVTDTFIPDVQQRGAAIIKARGASSAASAASAAIDHMREWALGTNGEWTSMAIPTDGSYGCEEGLFSSFPVTVENGKISIVQGLEVDEFSAGRIAASVDELKSERDAVKEML